MLADFLQRVQKTRRLLVITDQVESLVHKKDEDIDEESFVFFFFSFCLFFDWKHAETLNNVQLSSSTAQRCCEWKRGGFFVFRDWKKEKRNFCGVKREHVHVFCANTRHLASFHKHFFDGKLSHCSRKFKI